MNDNKKNKTFSDLFSNIEASNNNNKKINFNSIHKELEITEKKTNESNNIFNRVAKEEKNSLNSIVKESKNTEKENTNSSFNNLLKESKKENNKEELSLTDIFNKNNNSEIIKTESNDIFTEETNDNKEDLKEEKTTNEIFSNIDNKEINKEKSNDIFIKETNDNKEENIFFQDNNQNNKEEDKKNVDNEQEEDKKINNDDKQDELLDENPFFSDDENKEEINPFYNNNINLIENNNPNKLDETNVKIDTSNVKHFNVKIIKKKDPPLKFILGVLSYALFIWLLLIGVALLVYVADIKIRAARGDNSTPNYNAYVVLTGSMLPEIQVYDVVITKKIEPKNLKEGDIITFASSDTRFLNTIITHRIIKKYYDAEKKEYTFQTKGDNNNVADSALVQSNNIFGKVILKIPKLGYLQEFLASRGGWIIAILLPCVAVIAYDVVKLAKGLKRKKYKNIKVQSR